MSAFHRASRASLTALLAVASLCFIPVAGFSQTTQPSDAGIPAETIGKRLHDQVSPSLVVVKYNFSFELGSQDLTTPGIVVGDDGLTMVSLYAVTPLLFPADQLKDFKILVPNDVNPPEYDAELVARDERTNVAFIRPVKAQHWPAIHFTDSVPDIGDTIYSVGLLPKGSGYRTYITVSTVSAHLRGPVPQVLIDTGLTGPGTPVFNSAGQAIGLVQPRTIQDAFLDNPHDPNDIRNVLNPPKSFVPASDFLQSFADMPTKAKPAVIPWIGVPELKGLSKDLADYYKLGDTPAIQIGNVVAGSPADKAGIKTKDVLIAMNGRPLERGDLEDELPLILGRKIERLHVGDKVTLTLISTTGTAGAAGAASKPHDVVVTLEERPMEVTGAKRFYGEDMGLVVRDVVFQDLYQRHMTEVPGGGGVTVGMLKRSGAAETAKLNTGDLVTQINHKLIKNLDDFITIYKAARKDHPNDPVVLEVIQADGKQETINIQPPQTDVVPGSEFGQ